MSLLREDGQSADGTGALASVPEKEHTITHHRRERDDGDTHMEAEGNGPTWRTLAYLFGGLVLSGGGYLVGDTLTILRAELKDVRNTLDSRAGLASRIDHLERQADDQEGRLRALERNDWRRLH
jgi:hypothetical protein